MAFGDFIQAATAVNTSGTSATIGGAGWTNNITANNLIVTAARFGDSGANNAATVTSDSTPASFPERRRQVSTSDHTTAIHDGLNQTGGVKPTITWSYGTSASIRIVACEYAGSSNTTFDQTASATGSSSTPGSGATGTRAQATELQIGAGSANNNPAWTAGSGFTSRSDAGTGKLNIEDIVRTATGTEQADYTLSAGDGWACLTTTYSDGAAPAGRYVHRQILTGIG